MINFPITPEQIHENLQAYHRNRPRKNKRWVWLMWDKSKHNRKRKKRKIFRRRYTEEYRQWRKLVLEKYKHKCAVCGSQEELNVHHIVAWAKDHSLRFDVDNGKVLCFKCHKVIHPWLRIRKKREYKKIPMPELRK